MSLRAVTVSSLMRYRYVYNNGAGAQVNRGICAVPHLSDSTAESLQISPKSTSATNWEIFVPRHSGDPEKASYPELGTDDPIPL